MKSYFEDSIPFIKPQDVRVMVDGPDLWNAGNKQTFTRQTYTQVLLNTVRHATTPALKAFWSRLNHKPGMLTGYRDLYESSLWFILDDFGNLVLPEPDENGELKTTSPSSFLVETDNVDQSVFAVDDYGDCMVWDIEEETGDEISCYIYPLAANGDVDGVNFSWILPRIPGRHKIDCRVIPKDPQESGWEILHSHATLDGMLCIRWLGLYGNCPEEYKMKKWGFSGEPTNFWNGYFDVKNGGYDPNSRCTRRFARQMFQYETSMVKEVAAEVFPMEMGSLLARQKYHREEESIVGLVIDPAITQLRRIYAQDCYSQYNESTNQLEAERQYLEYWESWSGARAAYESLSLKKRLRRTYTEGFVRESTPCAVVVYGEEKYLSSYQSSWVKKFRKNGFPIYFLQPMEN